MSVDVSNIRHDSLPVWSLCWYHLVHILSTIHWCSATDMYMCCVLNLPNCNWELYWRTLFVPRGTHNNLFNDLIQDNSGKPSQQQMHSCTMDCITVHSSVGRYIKTSWHTSHSKGPLPILGPMSLLPSPMASWLVLLFCRALPCAQHGGRRITPRATCVAKATHLHTVCRTKTFTHSSSLLSAYYQCILLFNTLTSSFTTVTQKQHRN